MKAEKCIDCGKCTRACVFLSKHNINLKEFEHGKGSLCYECFLCGECKRQCPVNIDGREIALDLRKAAVKSRGLNKAPYRSILLEKNRYLFSNYSGGKAKTVLFPGCSFPSFFPKTTQKLIKLFKEKYDIGVVFDCCGKPIAELGMVSDEMRITSAIEDRLRAYEAEEIVTMCPNCYYFLREKINVKVLDIYTKLLELGFEAYVEKEKEYNVFMPCPDKDKGEILQSIKKLFHDSCMIKPIKGIQCCGLGGLVPCVDKELPAKLTKKLSEGDYENIYTYCASCYGNFVRSGLKNTKHILLDMLNMEESFPEGARALKNRASFKFKKY